MTTLNCFGVNKTSNVLSSFWNGSWSVWNVIGPTGFPPGSSITSLSTIPNNIFLFGVGTDGSVYMDWWSGNKWNGWTVIGNPGMFIPGSSIAAVSKVPNQLDLFVVGKDGSVYTSGLKVDKWSAWNIVGSPGLFLPGSPIAAVSKGPNQLDVFVVGKDGSVYSAWFVGNWNNWAIIGNRGQFTPGAPITVVSKGPDLLDLFVVGKDGCVYTAWFVGSWNNWATIGTQGLFIPGSPIAAISNGPNLLDLFVVGKDGGVYTAWFKSSWNNWAIIGNIGLYTPGSPIAALSKGPNQLDVFVVGKDGGVYTAWFGGIWNSWFVIGSLGVFPASSRLNVISVQDFTSAPTAATVPRGYLRFNSPESLKQTVQALANSKDKLGKLQELRKSANIMSTVGEFHSVVENRNESKNDVKVDFKEVKSKTKVGTGTADHAAKTDKKNVNLKSQIRQFDELVPDINFATLLNEDLQFQVGDLFYQITPNGTYFTPANNQGVLVKKLINNSSQTKEQSNQAILADKTTFAIDQRGEKKVGDYLYKGADNVFRHDTYGEAERKLPIDQDQGPDYPDEPEPPPPPPPTPGAPLVPVSNCGIGQPSSNLPTALPSGVYCTFPTYDNGAHTVLGGMLEGVFGDNSDHTENFNEDYRVKVKLYNFNYYVYSSVGLKVKFQKKGWFGKWWEHDCEQLVIGWDAMIFEFPQVFTAPIPYKMPGFPGSQVGRVISKELFKFINFEVPANTISQLSQIILGHDWLSAQAVEDKLKGVINDKLAGITTSLWNYAETQMAPNQFAFRDSLTKGFRMIYPDKFVLALSRWEQIADNSGQIDLLLDFNTCRLTYSSNLQGDFNFANNVLGPTYSNKSYSYTIKKASIFGAARFQGQWKGIRIIQE